MVNNQRKSGAILSYVVIVVNTIIQLIYTPFLIRILGQSEYGLYSLVSSIISYLTILDFGFGNVIVVYTAKYRAQKQTDDEKKLHGMFKVVFWIIAVIVGVVGVILLLCVDNIFANTLSDIELKKMKIMFLILIFNLVITFMFNIYSSIITAYEKFTFQKFLAIVATILKPALMLPLLFAGFKSIAMTVIITLINIMVVFSNYFYCKKRLNIEIKFLGFDKKLFKNILNYSIWIFIAVIVDKINWSIDQFLLGAISGTVAVSIYSVAASINNLFINLSTAVSGVLLPKVSKMVAKQSSTQELTDEMIKVGRIQFYIIFLMITGLILFGKEFVIMWAGRDYIDSYYCLLLLTVPMAVPLIQNLGISIRQALNKHKFASVINIFVAIFNFIISIFLIRNYGPVGAALGTAFGTLTTIILINFYYHFIIKLDMIKFWKNLLKTSIPFWVLFIVAFFVIRLLLVSDSVLRFIVGVCIYSLIYFAVAYFVSFNSYEKGIVNGVLKKIGVLK